MRKRYTGYKESGLTYGEVRKTAAKPKPTDVPVDLSFVDQLYDKLYLLDVATLSATLTKLRSMAYQKMKQLKV